MGQGFFGCQSIFRLFSQQALNEGLGYRYNDINITVCVNMAYVTPNIAKIIARVNFIGDLDRELIRRNESELYTRYFE